MTAALEGGEWSAARPGRILPLGKTLYPFYRRLGGPQAGLDGRKISSSPGFDLGKNYRVHYTMHGVTAAYKEKSL